MSTGPVDGELFRRNYLRSAVKLSDSDRARYRIYSHFTASLSDADHQEHFQKLIELELGLKVYSLGYGAYDFQGYWTKCDVGDFLSTITLWVRSVNEPDRILTSVRNIFAQENLHYRIDDRGGVHYLIDEEFATLSESTIAALADPRFGAARAALEQGLKALGVREQSGKALIRGIFEAAESTFLVLVADPKVNLLSGRYLEEKLKPILLARHGGLPEASDKVDRLVKTYSAWVHEAHPYRHGAPIETEHEAPLDFAILAASTGMGFIRLLANLVTRA